MASIVIAGGAIGGLCSGMLLARDGHEVTILERDEGPPAVTPVLAWEGWERAGVNQFRQIHYFLPRFRQVLEAELPEVVDALEGAGALRVNPIDGIPEERRGPRRADDGRFETLTARRPVMESVLAQVAAVTPGLRIRRGTVVTGLLAEADGGTGPPHVVGVRTDAGDIAADLVVDATGRRSPLPRWLDELGCTPVHEEREDSGFVYYARHFRSADGSIPPAFGPLLNPLGSISILTLPADNGTWGVGVIAAAADAEMRGLKEVDRWSAVLGACPLLAHWADAEPLADDVAVMAKIEDRCRRLVVDGTPIATGIAAVADSWACTNPSLGRGSTLGLLHAVTLRDHLRSSSLDDRQAFALGWDEATAATVEPWYQATLWFDRHRLAEQLAAARNEPYDAGDPQWEIGQALAHGAAGDPDLLRAYLTMVGGMATPHEVLAQPGIFEKVLAVGDTWRDAGFLGPSRAELVALVRG